MEYFIPTYDEAKAICDAYDNFQFYESVRYVDGYKVSCFNYRLVGYSDFINPLPDKPHIKSFELRGLCFVFNTDGTLFKRYLLMNKFFNLNENVGTQFDALKDIPIKMVEEKLDGSLISFIKLPNGRVYAKSKMVLDSEQAIAAQDIYNNTPNLRDFVTRCLFMDIIPMFEYVSPSNRIVLKYPKSELVLLKLRSNFTGHYFEHDILKLTTLGIKISSICDYSTWDEILPLKSTLTDKEGFVITLENGMMLKYKMDWYCSRHNLLTETIHREDFLIEKVVNDELDDIIAEVDANDEETLLLITRVKDKVISYLKHMSNLVDEKLEILNTKYNGNVRDFCINEPNDKVRNFVLSTIKGKESMLDIIKRDLLRTTYHLQDARKFMLK